MDAYVRKEQVYKEIVVALQALYKSDNTKQKATFIETTRVTEYVKANNRTCPQPTPWYKLWEMFWDRRRIGVGEPASTVPDP